MSNARSGRPVRLLLAAPLDEGLAGAWWPRAPVVATELATFADAMHDAVGQVLAIRVNWSSRDGELDLDLLTRRGRPAAPGLTDRPQRMMFVQGTLACANVLVVPSRTTAPLATLLMRHAAGHVIDAQHRGTDMFAAADAVVRSARALCRPQPGADTAATTTPAAR